MRKNGTVWHFFVLCFLALGGHCLQMLCLLGFGTHANTHTFVLSLLVSGSFLPQNAYLSWQTRDCQIVPVYPLSGSLNRLNAILSPLHPLNCYKTPSAIGSAIWEGATVRLWCYSVPNLFKTSAKRNRDRGRDSQPRPRPRLNSQPQGATP